MRESDTASVRMSRLRTVLPHRMRQRAMDADVIVVNHHLFFADLGVTKRRVWRGAAGLCAVILDEAHQIEMSHRNILDRVFELSAR